MEVNYEFIPMEWEAIGKHHLVLAPYSYLVNFYLLDLCLLYIEKLVKIS
jgi:hypothetical protein